MPVLPLLPSFGPFSGTVMPIVTTFLGILMAGVMTFCLYSIVMSIAEWVAAHKKHQFGGMTAAEEHLFPPLIGLCGLLMLPALLAAITTYFGI